MPLAPSVLANSIHYRQEADVKETSSTESEPRDFSVEERRVPALRTQAQLRMKPFLLSVGLTLGSTSLCAQMTMSLTSTASRGPVGAPVVWNARVDGIDHGDSSSDTIWYRYRARHLDQTFKIIRDCGSRNDLVWTATEHEGA